MNFIRVTGPDGTKLLVNMENVTEVFDYAKIDRAMSTIVFAGSDEVIEVLESIDSIERLMRDF